jgi:hypothetical protein
MLDSIITIVLGYVIWKYVPEWIKGGSASARSTINLVCSIVGIIMLLSGVVHLVKYLLY